MAAEDGSFIILATQVDAKTPPTAWTRVHVAAPTGIACGHFHFLAVTKMGVYGWGRGPLGVLGHGGEEDEERPRIIEALASEEVVATAAGPYHSAALTREGKLFVWGWMPFAPTASGMDETFSRVPRPVPLSSGVRVIGVACGCFASAAWDGSGQLYTWGRSPNGQLGHGGEEPVASPRPVEALMGVRVAQVGFGGVQTPSEHTGFMLVRSAAGVVFSCGSTKRGRLGRPYTTGGDESLMQAEMEGAPVHHTIPGEVRLEADARHVLASAIAAADNHAAALSFDGVPYMWGANDAGLLGLEPDEPDQPAPRPIAGLPPLIKLVTSAFSTAFLTTERELLLLGGDPRTARPRLAGLPGRVVDVFGGGLHVGVLLKGFDEEHRMDGEMAGPSSASDSDSLELESDSISSGGGYPNPSALLKDPSLTDAAVSAGPELTEMLLMNVQDATPLQLRHELRLLRDLLLAEQSKLHLLQYGIRADGTSTKPPSAGTWTDAGKHREGFFAEQMTAKEQQLYVDGGGGLLHVQGGGGTLYAARSSVLRGAQRVRRPAY